MNHKKRYIDDFWNINFKDIFKSFREEMDALTELESSEFLQGEPVTYGYSVRIGPDTNYQPEIRQWGNLNDLRRKMGLPEVKFPLEDKSDKILPSSTSVERFVDFIDEDEYLKVIIEVPGFTKSNITIDIDETGTELNLRGKTDNKEINEIIKLPSKIEAKTTKSSIKNGVLELRGKKSNKSSKKFNVRVE